MWEDELPEVSQPLRQGDLLRDMWAPTKGSLRVDEHGVSGEAEEQPSFAVVIDNCCTIEQTATVTIARVGRRKRPQAGSSTERGLLALEPIAGEPYTPYEHRLEPLEPYLPDSARWWVVKLPERVTYTAEALEDLAFLNAQRVARMSVVARVRFRLRVVTHFGREVAEDSAWLDAHGLDLLGRPIGD